MYISALEVEGYTKDQRRNIAFFEEKPYKVTFSNNLKDMLVKDYIYSAFLYRYAHRGHENICSEAEMIVIDVDNTTIDAFDRHQQLIDEDLTHIVATTSDVDNLFKYRVLLPLNEPVDPETYRAVVNGVYRHGLIADMDLASKKPSQFFSSYKGSRVFTFFEGSDLSVKDYQVEDVLEELDYEELSQLDYQQKRMYLLEKYSEGYKGYRRRTLVKASYDMRDLGFTRSQFISTVKTINERWMQPMTDAEMNLWVINPFIRKIRK